MSPENQPGVVTDVAIGVATQINKDKYDRIVTKDEYDMSMLCYVHLSFSQHFLCYIPPHLHWRSQIEELNKIQALTLIDTHIYTHILNI